MQVPAGSRKKPQSKSGRKQQVSGSRPREVRQHMVRSEGSDGRNLESVVVRDLMAETLHWSVVVRDQPLSSAVVVGPSFILHFLVRTAHFGLDLCLGVRDYSFISLTQSLLRNKSRQVLGKGREIFCLEDTDGQVLAKGCEIL